MHALLQAYGRIDRFDPLCYAGCIDSPFIILEHRVSGSYTYMGALPGAWDVKIAINAPGRYAIRLEVDGITSPILFFEARSSAARLEVVVQAQPRFDGNASNPGDIFDIQPGNVIILTSLARYPPFDSLPNQHFSGEFFFF